VRDRLILHAIHEAYRNVLPPAVFPAVLLFLDMPAEEVDVNVQSCEIEVRFRHPQFVHDFTRDSIRPGVVARSPSAEFSWRSVSAAVSQTQEGAAAALATAGAGNGILVCRAP